MDAAERLAVVTAEIRSLIRDVSQKIAESEMQIAYAKQLARNDDESDDDFARRLDADARSELQIVRTVRERLIAMLPDE